MAFSTKGSTLVSGSDDGTVRVWTVSNGKCRFVLEGDTTIRSLACDYGGRWIASGDENGVVTLWDFKRGEEFLKLKIDEEEPVVKLVFLERGKRLVAAGGKHVTMWDLSGR